jgi:hypothetical protein
MTFGGRVKAALRSTVLAVPVLVLIALGGVVSTFSSPVTGVALASTTVLVMGGTGHPLSTPPDSISYIQEFTAAATHDFVAPASTAPRPTGIAAGPFNPVAVITPESSGQDGGPTILQSVAEGQAALDRCLTSSACDHNEDIGSAAPSPSDTFVVFGYSQSAAIAMLEKRALADTYQPGAGPDVSFVVVGNARPNGGLLARDLSGLMTYLVVGVTRDELVTEPVPTDTQYSTVDIAIQYDGLSDFPLNPLNLLADLNAWAGMVLLHPTYLDRGLDEPGVVDQGQYGDTTYYLLPTAVLPLLAPLQQVPMVGAALADALDPPLRVLVEAAYDRTTSPGIPTPFNAFYGPDPVKLAADFVTAIPVGLDNGLQDLCGTRPFGTQRPGLYGVGGGDAEYATPPAGAAPTVSGSPTTATTTVGNRLNAQKPPRKPAKSTARIAHPADSASKPGLHRPGSEKRAS